MTDRKGVSPAQQAAIAQTETWGAHNYLPLPVVLHSGAGAGLTVIDGSRYLVFLSAYTAANLGHGNRAVLRA